MDAETAERVYQSVEFRERAALGALATMTAGCMDAYSYLTQGKVFATGQTGNCVLLAIHAAELDLPGVAHYLAPISSFFVGILVSKWVENRIHRRNHFSMQRWVLVVQASVFVVLSLLPDEVPDLLVNSVISLMAAFLFENFRKFGSSSTYSSIFCTGNLRSFAETLYEGTVHHNAFQRRRSLRYLGIVCAFLLGAVMVTVGTQFMGAACGWIVSVLSLVAIHFVTDLNEELENARERVESLQELEEEVVEEIDEAAEELGGERGEELEVVRERVERNFEHDIDAVEELEESADDE